MALGPYTNSVGNETLTKYNVINILSSKSEVPNHWDASRYQDLKKVKVGPEKPNWYIYYSFDVTRDQ